MKLIIDIPEVDYNYVKQQVADGITNPLKRFIGTGIPLDKIKAEIAEYKDDKVIHAERNEMIDIVLEILDKYREE